MKSLKYILLAVSALIGLTVILTSNTGITQTTLRVPTSDAEVKLTYAPVVRKVAPAVVNIYTKRVIKTRGYTSPFMNDPFFGRFFDGLSTAPRERIERSLGSGVIVRGEGIIVTNHHVIEGADEITVALSDRREYAAEVLLKDESTDLAVLKINAKGEILPILDFSDSKNVEVGDLVLAIGNPFGVGQSVSSGIISALARTQIGGGDYQFFIQTDAAVNPGNSGGALIGMDGKLVGINSAIFTRSGGSNGIGFAIPVKMVDHVVAAALSGDKLIRPWFGASGQAVTADIVESLGFDRPGGVLVDNIFSGSPADRAGLKQGDVILSVDGEEIFDTGGLRYHIGLMNPGGQMSVVVLSGEVRKTLTVVLEVAPEVPPRDITVLKGNHVFQNIQAANLSPAFSEEIGVDMFEKGVIILEVGGNSPIRRLGVVRPGDIFETIDDEKIETVKMLEKALKEGGNRVSFSVRREGRLIECNVGNRGGYFCQ